MDGAEAPCVRVDTLDGENGRCNHVQKQVRPADDIGGRCALPTRIESPEAAESRLRALATRKLTGGMLTRFGLSKLSSRLLADIANVRS